MIPLRLIFSYFIPPIKKYKRSFLLSFLGYGIAFVGASVITPLFYREIIDVIVSAESKEAIAEALMALVVTIAVIIVLYNVAFRLADYAMVFAQSKAEKDLSDYAFKKLQDHSYQFFVSTFGGSLVAKVKRYVRAFEVLHDNIVYNFWQVILQVTGIFIVLFILAPPIAGFFAAWSILYLAVTIFLVHKKRPYDLSEAEADSQVTASLADAVTNVLNIKMFASKKREVDRHAGVTKEEETVRRKAWNFNNLIMLAQGTLWMLLEVIGLFLVIKLWLEGSVSTGTIVLLQAYFAIIFGSMWNLGRAITASIKALSEASEIVEIFEKPLGVKDTARPEVPRIKNGEIAFEDVTFTYKDSVSVFENFNLKIEAGEKIGLVGHSGVGKTTITKLLLRFVDVREGMITIDGQDISRITQEDLRSKIAYVPQDPVLFHRTLRENIAYGKPDASEEEIAAVAQKAHAHEFISQFPKGYDTLVGERGVKLSGGERQRIAVARAMLKDAPILILDEATSSLDSLSEQYVQDAFAKLMEGKTTIVIAHRLSTIQRMDRIIVLEEGTIAEEGTHAELLRKEGIYHDFWTHQSGGFIS